MIYRCLFPSSLGVLGFLSLDGQLAHVSSQDLVLFSLCLGCESLFLSLSVLSVCCLFGMVSSLFLSLLFTPLTLDETVTWRQLLRILHPCWWRLTCLQSKGFILSFFRSLSFSLSPFLSLSVCYYNLPTTICISLDFAKRRLTDVSVLTL